MRIRFSDYILLGMVHTGQKQYLHETSACLCLGLYTFVQSCILLNNDMNHKNYTI